MERNPRDILEKKIGMTGKNAKSDSKCNVFPGLPNVEKHFKKNICTFVDEKQKVPRKSFGQSFEKKQKTFVKTISAEIDMKLFYLDLVHQLQEKLDQERKGHKGEIERAHVHLQQLQLEKIEIQELLVHAKCKEKEVLTTKDLHLQKMMEATGYIVNQRELAKARDEATKHQMGELQQKEIPQKEKVNESLCLCNGQFFDSGYDDGNLLTKILPKLKSSAPQPSFNDSFQPPPAVIKKVETSADVPLVIPQGPCMKFTNLFDLSEQLVDFCKGDYGSKFVIERLWNGARPEKDYIMKKLRLPDSLIDLVQDRNMAKVVSVLAKVEHKGRREILDQLLKDFSSIVGVYNGSEFIMDVLRLVSTEEKECVAASTDIGKEKLNHNINFW